MPQTILVIDDDHSTLRTIRHLAEGLGFTVITAPNGQSAVDILDETVDISLVISDVRMPRMDGIGVLQYLYRRNGEEAPKTLRRSLDNHYVKEGLEIPNLEAHVREYFGSFASFNQKTSDARDVREFLLLYCQT